MSGNGPQSFVPPPAPRAGLAPPPELPPLSPGEVQKARRATCRRVAGALISAMAEFDATFEDLGKRLNQEPQVARAFLHRLIEGEPSPGDLEMIADLATAMNAILAPQVGRRRP